MFDPAEQSVKYQRFGVESAEELEQACKNAQISTVA